MKTTLINHNTKTKYVVHYLYHVLTWRVPLFIFREIFRIDEQRAAAILRKSKIRKFFGRIVFRVRPCNLVLKYVAEPDDFFVPGKLYWSLNFTGATYAIKGYVDSEGRLKRIGCRYFEVNN